LDRAVLVICTLLIAISRKLGFLHAKGLDIFSHFSPLLCFTILFWKIPDPQLSLYFPWSHSNYVI